MLTGAREVMQSLLFLCSLQALFIPCLGARGVIRGIGGGGEPGILLITRHGIVDMNLFNKGLVDRYLLDIGLGLGDRHLIDIVKGDVYLLGMD